MRRRRKYKWESEEAMAAHVVAWLRRNGWDVYEEIQGVDIIAVRPDGFLWSIEAKRTMGLRVMEQAYHHRAYADAVSVAVPGERRSRSSRFGLFVARTLGIGVIEIRSPVQGWVEDDLVRNTVPPEDLTMPGARRFFSHRRRVLVESCLTPAAKASGNRAGQARNAGWSPFKETVAALRAFVKSHPRPTMKEAVDGIQHHYASSSSARSSLSRLFGGTAIPGLRLVYDRARRKHVIEEIADDA